MTESSYHGQIINLPATPPPDVTESPVKDIRIAYKTGHRDARHAAAELAIQADQRIAELEAQLRELLGVIEAHDARLESCDRDGNTYCDCLERAIEKLKAE